MIGALNWLTPEAIHALGWTLLHFLWQGAAIALLLYMAAPFSRSAVVRYNLSLSALVLMVASPVVTFFVLRSASERAVESSPIKEAWQTIEALPNSPVAVPASVVSSLASVDWLRWFVCAWIAGVLVFGIRALGGWMILERLRREKAEPIAANLLRRCVILQQRLGLSRTVSYLQSQLMDSPAVVGWFRPLILLPVTALSGLSPEELDAVIAHELGHIKRLDCFVNLFQIAAETVLFYHPAVWWVSRSVRLERENCCDDMAVRVCGNASTYARALTLMETWRVAPALVLAANSGSLKSRISRLLGFDSITHSVPRGGLAAIGVLCAAGALLATTNFRVSFHHPSDAELLPLSSGQQTLAQQLPVQRVPPTAAIAPASARRPTVTIARNVEARSIPADPPEQSTPPAPPPPLPPEEPPAKDSYIDGMRSAGITNITVDELIALKSQGVTPEYVREMRAAGLNPSVHELISMKAQGVDPQYVREIRSSGLNPSERELISMKAMGVSPDYVRKVRSAWSDVGIHDLIAMRAQGVEPSDAAEFARLGLKDLTVHQLISLKAMGVTPEYIRAMQATGLPNLSTRDYISAKAMGVTPEYIHSIQSAGFSRLTIHDYVSAKAQGITPEFIQTVHSHGFTNLSLRQLIGLKMANVF